MATERNLNEPYRPDPADDPYRIGREDDYRRAARFDNELQMDPELAGGPASGGRITLLAVAVALLLGAAFYGLNDSSMNHAGTSTAQNTEGSPPAAPPGMRDVTPRANSAPGVTRGAAPARPMPPPTSNAPGK
jgi:hypothetical protein